MAAIFLASGSASAQTFPDSAKTLEIIQLSDSRVASVGMKLAIANAPYCPIKMPATGLVLHSLSQYSATFRKAAVQRWQFPSTLSVAAVVPGSSSEKSGLASGDGILAVNGKPVPESTVDLSPTSIRDSLEREIQALPPEAPIRFDIIRNGVRRTFVVSPDAACRTSFEVSADPKVVARSDGKTIQVGISLLDRIDDQNLAVVLAHELAHTILGHRTRLAAIEAGGGREAKARQRVLARQFEDDADLFALGLLARAGFDPWSAPRFMRKFGPTFDPVFSSGRTHRSASARARRMERALETGSIGLKPAAHLP